MKKNKDTQKKDEVLEKFYAQNKTHPAYLSLAKIRNMLSFLGYDGRSVGRFEKDFELIEKILKAVDEIEVKTGIKITELPNTIDLERIVENYRKAAAFDLIKKRGIDVASILIIDTFSAFNYNRSQRGLTTISKSEYDFIKEALSWKTQSNY